MSRLVFGESPSPSEIRRVQRASIHYACARFDMPPTVRTAKECAACRLRSVCGTRRDDPVAAYKALRAAEAAAEHACIKGDRCPNFPFCGHVPVTAETIEEAGL
jgi:hypothetical protein